MKVKQLFVAGMIALASDQTVHAEEGTLPEVTVTSTTIDDRFDSKRGEASNINNISGKKVDDRHGRNIVDILSTVPGVTAEVQSGDSVKIELRGVEAQRYMGEKPGVAIVIDGVPVNERTGRVNIDLDNIESIKVIKGGASYLFGEDALSGAVIITTKRGAKMAGLTASSEQGSFGYTKDLARLGISEGNFVGHVQATKVKANDYYDQGAYSRRYYNGKLQYLISETSDISFGFEQAVRAKDSHGTVTGVTNALLDPRSATSGGKDYARMYDVNLDKLNLTYANDLGASGSLLLSAYEYKDHTRFKSGPSGYLRNANGTFLYGTSAASDMRNFRDVYVSQNDNNQTQTGFKGEWRKGGEAVGLMAGLDLRRDEDKGIVTNLVNYTTLPTPATATTTLNLAGARTADNVVTTNTKALYGEMKWRATDPLTLTLNARRDNLVTGYSSNLLLAAPKINSGERTFGVWSERLGANYALSPDKEIYSNISTGFRVPTAAQLYGSTITPTGSVLANPDLRPEHAVNKEIGLRAKNELFGIQLDMDIALFQIDRKDFILNTAGQYYSDRSAPLADQYQNIGGVRNRGVELGVKTDAKETWSGDIAYTYLDARFTRNDTYWMTMGNGTPNSNGSGASVLYNNTGHIVPRTPKHKVNLNTRYRYTEALTFSAEVNAQSGIFADEVNVVWVGGRTVANIAANYELKSPSGSKMSLFGRVDNLFKRYYYTTIRGSSDSNGDGVYNAEDPSITVNPGRVYTVGLTLNF